MDDEQLAATIALCAIDSDPVKLREVLNKILHGAGAWRAANKKAATVWPTLLELKEFEEQRDQNLRPTLSVAEYVHLMSHEPPSPVASTRGSSKATSWVSLGRS